MLNLAASYTISSPKEIALPNRLCQIVFSSSMTEFWGFSYERKMGIRDTLGIFLLAYTTGILTLKPIGKSFLYWGVGSGLIGYNVTLVEPEIDGYFLGGGLFMPAPEEGTNEP